MSLVSAILIIGAAGIVAALGTFFVHSKIEVDIRRRHHEAGAVVFLQLGVIFAVLLAFVFSEAWDGYNSAGLAIDLECSALHSTAMLASSLRAEQARTVLEAQRDYLSSVVNAEWRIMDEQRTESVETDRKLQDLITTVAALKTLDPDTAGTRSHMLATLTQAHTQRAMRIFQASINSGIPGVLWAVLIAFSTVLVLCVSFSSIQYKATAIVITAIFAAGIVSILVVVRMLDYPFEGALALHAEHFAVVLGKVTDLLASGAPPHA